jgi:outer membrane receptor protein involved in Fe transport
MGRRAVDITNGDCLPPVWLVGADVRVAVGGHVEFVLSGENLGDVRYEEYAGYPAPSRAFFLTAEFDFLPATPVLHGPPM